jgi:hypothetical protein
MGGHPWWYLVPYQSDIEGALAQLKEREFEAGRYNPAIRFPPFPLTPDSPAPGPRHATIEEALDSSAEDGTRSILDMVSISDTTDYQVVSPLNELKLIELFGTTHPSRAQVETSDTLFEILERGKGVYLVVYEEGQPSEIFFAGYSFD